MMKSFQRFIAVFFASGSIILTLMLLPPASHAVSEKKNAPDNITLAWETPEEGSAVSFNSEKEYVNAPPVLRSSRANPVVIKTSIPMAPTLKRLILPGSEDSATEDVDDNTIGIEAAKKALEFYENKTRTVNVNGTVLNIETDCSYFVRAAYWEGSHHTRDLFMESLSTKSINPNKATGVTLLAAYFEKNHRYITENPRIGDIIVFDNTYDKNNNQVRDDFFTHVGIVTGIRDDGTIEFVHGNISRTIKKGYINFKYKDVSELNKKPVNSYIRPHYSWEKDVAQSLADHLVRAFAGF
jgi:hypothetical protein